MQTPPSDDPGNAPSNGTRRTLLQVRAAQLRAKVVRWAIGKCLLGIVFLAGALSYALSPDRHSHISRLWMALLLILSTLNMGLGLRTFSRVRRGLARYWMVSTACWGIFSTVIIRVLMRR